MYLKRLVSKVTDMKDVNKTVEALRYKPEGRRFDSRWCHCNFFFIYIALPAHAAPNRNDYQKHFLGIKAADAWGWQTYHLHVPTVSKSEGLCLLEPSGPVISHYMDCSTFTLHKVSYIGLYYNVSRLKVPRSKYGWDVCCSVIYSSCFLTLSRHIPWFQL